MQCVSEALNERRAFGEYLRRCRGHCGYSAGLFWGFGGGIFFGTWGAEGLWGRVDLVGFSGVLLCERDKIDEIR